MNKIIITIIAISMLYPADNTVNVKGNEKKGKWYPTRPPRTVLRFPAPARFLQSPTDRLSIIVPAAPGSEKSASPRAVY